MKKLSLQARLVRYLQARPYHKVAKGRLEELAKQKMGVTGETVGRRLRVLHEASGMTRSLAEYTSSEHAKALELLSGGKINVEHRDKQHCWYWYEPPATQRVRAVKVIDGRAVEIYEEITNTKS